MSSFVSKPASTSAQTAAKTQGLHAGRTKCCRIYHIPTHGVNDGYGTFQAPHRTYGYSFFLPASPLTLINSSCTGGSSKWTQYSTPKTGSWYLSKPCSARSCRKQNQSSSTQLMVDARMWVNGICPCDSLRRCLARDPLQPPLTSDTRG